MSIANWSLPKPLFSLANLAWLGGFLLLFWSPFWGAQRMPLLILLGVGLILHLQSRRWLPTGRAQRRWGVIFLLLWLPCLLATPGSLAPQASLNLSLVLLLHYWVGLALLSGLAGPGHPRMARWLGLLLLFWAADGALQFALGRDLFGVPISEDGRVLGPFAGNMHMGLFLVVLMPLLLWPLARTRPWLAILLFVPLGAISALAGARTNLVFAVLAALVLMPALPTWKHRIPLLLLSLSPALTIPFSPTLKERVLERNYDVMAPSASGTSGELFDKIDRISTSRLVIWENAGRMWLAHPWTGVGPGAFDRAYPHYATRASDPYRTANKEGKHAYHAHQMYISALAETGLIGLAGLLAGIALVVRWYRAASPLAREAANPWLACLAIIAFPINSQPVLFTGWWFPVVLLLLCGVLAALEGDARREPVLTGAQQ